MDKAYTWLCNKFNLVIFRIDRISLAFVGAILNRVSPTSRHPIENGSRVACTSEPGLSYRHEMTPHAQEAVSSALLFSWRPRFHGLSLLCWV